jgi:hypothetical protein
MKEKCLKNNAKHENEQVQKKGLTNRSIWHMLTDKKMTNKSPKEKWWLKNKGNKRHKKWIKGKS